jgi:hypothetical protein
MVISFSSVKSVILFLFDAVVLLVPLWLLGSSDL